METWNMQQKLGLASVNGPMNSVYLQPDAFITNTSRFDRCYTSGEAKKP